MKKPLATSLSLLALWGGLYSKEPLLQPLDLERVVIRGQARVRPVSLAPKGEPVDMPKVEAIKSSPTSNEKPPSPIQIHNTFKTSAARHQGWSVFDSLLLKRNLTSASFVFQGQGDDGFREGYQNRHSLVKTEWSQRSSKELHLKAHYSWDRRNMDRPTPLHAAPSGADRTESIHRLKVRFESPYLSSDRYSIIFEHLNASQVNSQENDYRYLRHRLGFVTTIDDWEAALSVEVDKKDQEQTTLGRLFFKHSGHILDPRTSVHIGLGAYGISSRESSVNPSGVFTLRQQNKNSSLAFSPYFQLDHTLNKEMAFYASYTHFYQQQPIVDVFFNRPEASRPSSIIQPSLNIEIETGLRWDLGQDWKMGWSYTWKKAKDQAITVIDSLSPHGHLTQEIWSKGRQGTAKFELLGVVFKNWNLDFSAQHTVSSWNQPAVNFTPFEAKTFYRTYLGYRRERWDIGASYRIETGRRAYPNSVPLKNLRSVDLEGRWSSWKNLQLEVTLENIFDHESEMAPGYPNAPWNMRFGLRTSF